MLIGQLLLGSANGEVWFIAYILATPTIVWLFLLLAKPPSHHVMAMWGEGWAWTCLGTLWVGNNKQGGQKALGIGQV